MAHQQRQRENWVGRIGLILAVAGSAVGLGNFLRFPGLVAQNGGGAFLIPYFIAFLLLGLPVCWMEWTMGRFGGKWSHGSAPGVFDALGERRKPWLKYLGVLGVIGPLGIFFYYIFVESWTLGYTVFAVTGRYREVADPAGMKALLGGYLAGGGDRILGLPPMYFFFLVTFAVNFWILYRGVTRGIEAFCKIAMPLLFAAGFILMVRVLTLGAPVQADWNVSNGLGFLWNPDFTKLASGKVWLAAAGQIFFTLSVGMGVILSYASYVRPKQDVALSALTSASMNEFAEVVLGGSIVIPAAVCFFGAAGAREATAGGTFGLGFQTMPLVFNHMAGGPWFGTFWFVLLFVAGVTSSISLLQPVLSFLEDEVGLSRRKAMLGLGGLTFAVAHMAIFGDAVIDEMDFWFSSFALPLFGLVQVLIFLFVFGADRGWKELHHGADIRLPRVFKFVMTYVTPVYLAAVLLYWLFTDGWQTIICRRLVNGALEPIYTAAQLPWVWATRLLYLALIVLAGLLVRYAWRRRALREREETL
jgi:SNF family Na+-dependent transporter